MATPTFQLQSTYTPVEARRKLVSLLTDGKLLRDRAGELEKRRDLTASASLPERVILPMHANAWITDKHNWTAAVEKELKEVFRDREVADTFRAVILKKETTWREPSSDDFDREHRSFGRELHELQRIAEGRHKSGRPLRVFISHASDDADAARGLRTALEQDFGGFVELFVSSDPNDVALGRQWLETMHGELSRCDVLVILCTPTSRERPWVHFEAGAAWILGRDIVPVCHRGLDTGSLPSPLAIYQAVTLTEAGGLEALYRRVAAPMLAAVPQRDFTELAASFAAMSR